MDRGAWQATLHGVARVGHHLATKPPPPLATRSKIVYMTIQYSHIMVMYYSSINA